MEEYYLTAERLSELKAELSELKTKTRMEVAERLKRAKELGDLSENVEYQEAREQQGQVEKRIFDLEDMIKRAVLIKKGGGKGSAQIGSTVLAKKDGKEFSFTIVGTSEARPEDGFISNESPLGKAFLDRRVGDEVIFRAPIGEIKYKIISVK